MSTSAQTPKWRNRILETGTEDPEQLLANPRNWRVHPKVQQKALEGVLDQVGWVTGVIVNQRTGFVVDGHARVAAALSRSEPLVPVTYVDLTEEEEALVLATIDPLSAMAGTDTALLGELLEGLTVTSEELGALVTDLRASCEGAGPLGYAEPGQNRSEKIAALVETVRARIAVGPSEFTLELVDIESLKPHPRNYRVHPEDQIKHLMHSIKEHGLYRNVVLSRDGTILAGHGIVLALKKMDVRKLPAIRLDVEADSPTALKVLTGDNEIEHLGMVDDRIFTEILKDIKNSDVDGLLGTGYDDMMLANLLFVTRPKSEIENFDEAAAWVGMPEYETGEKPLQIVINFPSEEDRLRFVAETGMEFIKKETRTWTTRWPYAGRDDTSSVRLDTEDFIVEEEVPETPFDEPEEVTLAREANL